MIKSPEFEAWKHAITHLKNIGEEFDIFLSLPATSPLRDQSDVNTCLEALDSWTQTLWLP